MTRLDEEGVIRIAASRARAADAVPRVGRVRVGIGDDAAVLSCGGEERDVALTTDALIEEVHFRRDWTTPADLGWKALAVNLSDLGAMGAFPLAAVVSLGLPPDTPPAWVRALYAGIARCAAAYSCPVVGGDTVRSPRSLVVSVTAVGVLPPGGGVLRSGARPGDWLCVTGVLGESAAGLALLERGLLTGPGAALRAWHRRPVPPVEAGIRLAEGGLPTAMMDLSDGVAWDAGRLASASRVGLLVERARLPISDETRRTARRLGEDPYRWALHGGEDYQLLFTVPPDRFPEVPPLLAPLGVVATRIGAVTGRGCRLLLPDGSRPLLRPDGFSHFPARP